MTRLFVDLGNSNCKWRYAGPDKTLDGSVAIRKRFTEALQDNWQDLDVSSIWVASVAELDVESRLADACKAIWSHSPRFMRTPDETGCLKNAYARPHKLGVDRWCAMLGSPVLGQCPFVMVDCGSALTLDTVNAGGQHLGGLILGGTDALLNGLNQKTGLPVHQEIEQIQLHAIDTETAIQSAAWLAQAALVDRFFKQSNAQLGEKTRLFITGGYSGKLAGLLESSSQRIDNAVLDGLIHWVETNEDMSG